MFRHIVLFRVHDEVSDERIIAAMDDLRSLSTLPGIVSWRVERSTDVRKGRVVVEDATFVDAAAFEAFRLDAEHVRVARRFSEIADWWVGDYAARSGV
ncbi:Dabb family protein [Microbacterium hominis]|uniref:Sulfite reductase, beta subunit n=1 Tax=Microbacterium hominis TaxID=162426 RepID=A0A0B4DYP2_9MICO|nr:Dabb family protein [Microbacterium hominis]KIC59378.1 sulfite reductase, beta subunit [Microbacterium hominis]